MNEGSGQNVRDWSFRGNDGFLGTTKTADSNDPAWIRGVFLGSALRFDGENDFVTVPSSSDLEPQRLTVAAWVRGTGPMSQFRYLLGKGSDECQQSSYGMYTSGNRGVAFYVADAERTYRSAEADPTIWDGKWHHVAGTFDGRSVRLFVDGVQVGTPTPAETTIDYSTPSGNGAIGSYPGTCSPALTLNGDIDGVQIWSTALPVDTIWSVLKPIVNLAR
jgi:hypothetical protein